MAELERAASGKIVFIVGECDEAVIFVHLRFVVATNCPGLRSVDAAADALAARYIDLEISVRLGDREGYAPLAGRRIYVVRPPSFDWMKTGHLQTDTAPHRAG